MSNNPGIKIEVDAIVSRNAQLTQLATDMQALKTQTGVLDQNLNNLTGSLRSLLGQQAVVDTFRKLKTESVSLGQGLQTAQTNITALRVAIASTGDPTGNLTREFDRQVASARQLSSQYTATNQKLQQYRTELNATKQAGETLAQYQARLRQEYTATAADINRAVTASKAHAAATLNQRESLDELRKNLSALRAEVRGVNANNIDTYTSIANLQRLQSVAGKSRGELVVLVNTLREMAAEQQALVTIRRLDTALSQLSVSALQTKQRIAAYQLQIDTTGDAAGVFAAKQEKAKTALSGIDTAIARTNERLTQLKTQYGLAGASGAALAQAQDTLRGRFTAAQTQADGLVASLRRVQEQQAAAGKETSAFAQGVDSLRSAFIAFFGVYQLAGMINNTRKLAEEWANLESRLSIVTDSSAELADVQGKLKQLAEGTYAPLSETVNLYVKAKDALTNLGTETAEVIDLVGTWNKGIQLNGSTTAAAAGATLQFTQALSMGRVMAEEFNSMAEGNSYVMQRLAKAILGETGSVGALKNFAIQGKLTSSVLMQAFADIKDSVDRDFEQLPLNITRAMTVIKTRFTEFVGTSETVQGAISGVARQIVNFSDNLEDNTANLGMMAAALGGLKFGQLLAGMVDITTAGRVASVAVTGVTYALAGLGAGLAGYSFGSFLKDQFVDVEVAGIALMSGLHQLGLTAKLAFDVLSNPGNIGTVWDDYIVEMDKVQMEYADLAEYAMEAHSETQKAAKETVKAEEQATKAAEKMKYAGDLATKAIQTLGIDVAKAGGGFSKMGTDALKAFTDIAADAASTSELIKQAMLAATSKMTQDELPALRNQFIATFATGKVSVDDFAAGIRVIDAQLGNVTNTADAVGAAITIAMSKAVTQLEKGKLSSSDFTKEILLLINKFEATGQTATVMGTKLLEAYKGGKISITEYMVLADRLATTTHKAVATSVAGIGDKVKAAFQQGRVSAEAYQAVVLATSGKQTTLQQQGEVLKVRLEQLWKAGVITAKEYEALVLKITNAQNGAVTSTDELKAAMSGLGLTSSAALTEAANKAAGLYRQVQLLGGTAHDTKQAFLAYADAQLKADQASGKLTNSQLTQQAATLKLSSELGTLAASYGVAAGKQETTKVSTETLSTSLNEAGTAASYAADSVTDYGSSAGGAVGYVDALTAATQRNTAATWAGEEAARAARIEAEKVRDAQGFTQRDRDNGLGKTVNTSLSASQQASVQVARDAGISDARITEELNKAINAILYSKVIPNSAKNQGMYDRAVDEAMRELARSNSTVGVGMSASQRAAASQVMAPPTTPNPLSPQRVVTVNLQSGTGNVSVQARAEDEDNLLNTLGLRSNTIPTWM